MTGNPKRECKRKASVTVTGNQIFHPMMTVLNGRDRELICVASRSQDLEAELYIYMQCDISAIYLQDILFECIWPDLCRQVAFTLVGFLYSDELIAGDWKRKPDRLFLEDRIIGTRLEREENAAELAGAAIVEDREEVESDDEDEYGEEDGLEQREAALAEAMTWLTEQFGEGL
ncbi:hypothetical protein FPQ18DRAFT_310168 [Pyronema domesticum]|nr:hypothetical protein FPQ18DRAFT_310168 [Pyronema domesticum]